MARTLNRRAARSNACAAALPPMLFVTDPQRTPDPLAVAERLPPGAGVIYRAFGAADAVETALALRRLAERKGLVLLVGADVDLARRSGAHGLHLPERDLQRAPRVRARQPLWRITGAAHGARGLQAAAAAHLDAVLISPVFPSRSPSATTVLTPLRLAALTALAAQARLPVYALGGVAAPTAARLLDVGVAGLAAVEGLSSPRA